MRFEDKIKQAFRFALSKALIPTLICLLFIGGSSYYWYKMQQPIDRITNPALQPAPVLPTPSLPTVEDRSKWQIAGKTYQVKGTIQFVNETSDTLISLVIKVDGTSIGPDSTVQNPNYPFASGSTAEVIFNQRLKEKGSSNPKIGDSVVIGFTQYAVPPKTDTFWGSSFDHYYAKQNNDYYNANGEKLGGAK